MKALLPALALCATAAPLAANSPTPEALAVRDGVNDFFTSLASDDKTALARQMVPEGMIFIHDRRTPDAPRLTMVPVAKHLENWLKSPADLAEVMHIEHVLVDGDMAQVWGTYYFTVAGELSHCGINSLSMVRREGRWLVANTSFTMDAPEACAAKVAEVNSHIEFEQ
ncbi:MAG: nuclear transport factor 2 family protein [Rhizobiales bacterium]|nr:nuclear transport factor 2 family protein [Hyphomicrobiales bacterium]